MLSDREDFRRVDIVQVSIASKLLTDLNGMTCIERKGIYWKPSSGNQRSLISILMGSQGKSLIVQERSSA